MYQRATIGYCTIIVHTINDETRVYTHDWKTAKEALENVVSWEKHFDELRIKHPNLNQVDKIVTKRVLMFGQDHALSDITLEQLKELAK